MSPAILLYLDRAMGMSPIALYAFIVLFLYFKKRHWVCK
nr:MAG TPA: hypothetical protein [Caudoviricetes sp.]